MKKRDDGLTFWTGEYVYPWSVWYPAEWLLHSLHDIPGDPLLALREVGKRVEIDFDPLARYAERRLYLARMYRCFGPTVPLSRLVLLTTSPGPVWDWAERYNLYRPKLAAEPAEVPAAEVAFYFALATLVALTLKNWAELPSRREARELARLPELRADEDTLVREGRDLEQVAFSVPAFAPSAETEADFLKRVAAAARNHSASRVVAGENGFREAGAFRPPHRLEPDHFHWLALFQSGGLSFPEIQSRIADKTEITIQGVRQGVHRAASLAVGEPTGWLRSARD